MACVLLNRSGVRLQGRRANFARVKRQAANATQARTKEPLAKRGEAHTCVVREEKMHKPSSAELSKDRP
jgi:hypothetical protein